MHVKIISQIFIKELNPMSDKTYKRRFGDRRDARMCRDVPPLQTIMAHLFPNRTDNEAYLHQDLDITELLAYLSEKNLEHPDYKTTMFHALIFAMSKMVYERPKMNRFIQGRRMFERNEISAAFVARRRFVEHSEESLMFFVPKPEDTLATLSYKISGEVHEMRKSETATGGVDAVLAFLSKIPRIFLIFIVRIVRWLDFWGWNPKALTDGDPNYSSIFLTNLGSVGCPAVYHHLNNYGTNSFMIAVGMMRKEKRVIADGTEQIRDIVDVGVTIDERIGDGFYFARSLKLVQYLFSHPEMLYEPISAPSNIEY